LGQAKVSAYPAQPVRRIIERPRLISQLEESDAQTILLIAPAGYGKTTLARQWCEATHGIWMGMTPAACDLAFLSRTLVDSLFPNDKLSLRLVEQVLALNGSVDSQAQALVSAISARARGAKLDWLVIDDYQAVASSQPAGLLLHGLHASRAIRLMIASRVRPDWVTSRELVYGEAVELRTNDLALEIEETSQLFGGQESASFIQDFSRGWPAAIGLAAHIQSTGLELNSQVLSDSMYDYLADELYRHASSETRADLERLAVHPVVTYEQAGRLLDGPSATDRVLRSGLANEVGGRVEIHPLARAFLLMKLRSQGDYDDLVASGVDFAIANEEWDDQPDRKAHHLCLPTVGR
jgi:LuxR family transcriptional regulator, maltose regulon positive regulatory protein